MSTDLLKRLAQAAGDIFNDTPVFVAYAYGSRVQGHPRSDSDLDVGYYIHTETVSAPPAIQEEMQMADRLSRILGIEIDLRNLGTAPLELRGRVLEQGRRIYCSDHVARVNLERNLLGMYHDYKAEFELFHTRRLCAVAALKG